jgi:hypothetical protein
MPALEPVDFRSVPTTEIDLEDRTYAIAPAWFPLGSVAQVVARYGVFSPISLEAKEAGGYRVVSGFRRLQAARVAGLERVPGAVCHGDKLQLFTRALAERASTRPLHLLEKAFTARKLIDDFRIPQPEVTREFLPLLGVSESHFELRRLLEIAEIPRTLQEPMLTAGLQPEIALCVARWEAGGQASFLTLFREMKPGFNHQKELCTLLDELRARDQEPADRLLARVREERQLSPETPAPAQLQVILAGLRAMRYPRLSEQEARYRELKAALRLPPGVQFQPPPFFEGQKIALAFSVASPAELKAITGRLTVVAEKPELEQIFELL